MKGCYPPPRAKAQHDGNLDNGGNDFRPYRPEAGKLFELEASLKTLAKECQASKVNLKTMLQERLNGITVRVDGQIAESVVGRANASPGVRIAILEQCLGTLETEQRGLKARQDSLERQFEEEFPSGNQT